MDNIMTVATVPAVLALVTMLKDLGLPSRFAPLGAILLGVVLALMASSVVHPPRNWYESVSLGILLGLSASGLYDGARAIQVTPPGVQQSRDSQPSL